MLIELKPPKPNFSRGWVTGGAADFDQEVTRWMALHAGTCHGYEPLRIIEDTDVDDDGVRYLWIYCDCGERRQVLGPFDGRPMQPTVKPLTARLLSFPFPPGPVQ